MTVILPKWQENVHGRVVRTEDGSHDERRRRVLGAPLPHARPRPAGAANPLLVEVAAELPPGRALDLGTGRGGDALWLAARGWQVTAVDIADAALTGLVELAREQQVADRVVTERHDLAETFPDGAYDLISAQYFHTPFDVSRAAILRRAAEALRPGGRLLVVDHGSIAPWSWNQDPDTHFATPDEVAGELALDGSRWQVERADMPVRLADGPDGQRAEVTDNVLVVRRAA